MADDSPETETAEAPPACSPCRGTGRVVSRLGGSASTITCPWCRGTGVLIPGHDAQQADDEGEPSPEPPPAVA